MKKALSLILVLALAASMLCTAAFAEGSKTDVFQPTGSGSKTDVFQPTGSGSKTDVFDATGSGSKTNLFDTFEVEFTETESKLDVITVEEMAVAIAEAEEDVDAEALVVVSQQDYTAGEYPVFVTFYGEGTEEVTICQFVKYEGADTWKLIYTGLAGEWTAEFEAAGTYAIAVLAD